MELLSLPCCVVLFCVISSLFVVFCVFFPFSKSFHSSSHQSSFTLSHLLCVHFRIQVCEFVTWPDMEVVYHCADWRGLSARGAQPPEQFQQNQSDEHCFKKYLVFSHGTYTQVRVSTRVLAVFQSTIMRLNSPRLVSSLSSLASSLIFFLNSLCRLHSVVSCVLYLPLCFLLL